MAIHETKEGFYEVRTEKEKLTLYSLAEPGTTMVNTFLTNPEALASFEAAMDEHGAGHAFRAFNNIESIQEKNEEVQHDEKAKTFSALMKAGNFEDAYYELNGLKKPEKEEMKL